jgi:hypothetical protein
MSAASSTNWARPELKVTEYAVGSGADVRRKLDELGPGLRVILVYAPPTLTYGQLMGFVGPALSTHGTVHVYLDPSARAADPQSPIRNPQSPRPTPAQSGGSAP